MLTLARPCWLRLCLFSNLVAFARERGQALGSSKTCKTMQCSKPFLPGNRSRPYAPCPSGDDGPSCVDHFSHLVFWVGDHSSRHLEPKRAAGKINQTLTILTTCLAQSKGMLCCFSTDGLDETKFSQHGPVSRWTWPMNFSNFAFRPT